MITEQTGITHYNLDDINTYSYYSPTVIQGLFLVHSVPASILDQDSEVITSIAKHFMNTVLVIVFLLVVVVFFVEVFYTMKVNKSRDTLLLEQQRYKVALSHSKDSIWEYDIKTDTLTKSDPNLGLCVGSHIVHDFRNTLISKKQIHPDDVLAFHQFCDNLSSDLAEFKTEIRTNDEHENYAWYELYGTKIYDSELKPVSVIGRTCNIHDKKLEIETLRQKAGQDTLTKLYNRITLRETINDLINSLDIPVILGFLIVDIDNFKNLNDKLGHLFGDAVLIDVSGRLTKLFRPCDVIGRVGGDEFAVIVNNAPNISYVQDMANQIRNLFHDIYAGEDSNFELSCTIGISLYPTDGINYDNLYEKAELALYHAKMQGKNQIAIYGSSMDNLSQMDTLILKKKKEDEINYHHEDRSLVDSTIIANAIEILFDSREIDISINMMLSLIGVYYNLSRIDIFEYGESKKSISITHEWYSSPEYKLADIVQELPSESFNRYNFYQRGETGVMHCDDITEYYNTLENKENAIELNNVKSIFQCGISDHGHYIGYISVCICDELHKWTKNEIDSLSLLSKVIGSYLIRLRSMQKADLILQRDLLTNAYNFNTFLTVVNQKLKATTDLSYAMIYSDIHQFKLLNDNYGYQAGDEVLKNLAKIFLKVGGNEAILCRITGDKFVLLMPYKTKEDLAQKANYILVLSKQIKSTDIDYYKLNIIVGIYEMAKSDNAIVAVDRANIARKNAQKLRKDNYVFFNEKMHEALIEQKKIEDVMEDALLNEEFIVYFQPKIDMTTSKICGAEALVRWLRPQIGLVSPASFIPLFENNGFITQLDYYVLEKVCAHLRDKIDRGIHVLPISVNFSREHFKSDALPDYLKETVEKYNLPPRLIEVEITESALVNSDHCWLHVLQKIRKLGFGLAMDDFGSGLSSLNLLCDLPFKILKIDKDFFHSKTTHRKERIVISNIVRMAHELDMEVICEGVETKEQAQFLQSIGCFMAQGYYYDKPLPLDIFETKYYL
jgi:diguanylate cyclase (GGDEF)-like protein